MPDSMLPEKHFPLQDLELERTDFYTFEGDRTKPMILFGLRGPGGMNCLWPVVEHLRDEGYPIDLLIDSAAKKILETKNHGLTKQPSESPLKRIMEVKPAVAVSEFSADAGTALAVTWSEESYGVPVVWVEDYPDVLGSYTDLYNSSLRINPDYLCAISEATKDLAIKRRPTMDPSRIIVTGHPDYDKYADINGEEIRNETRKKLEVDDGEFMIVYSGLLPPQTPEVLEQVVENLNRLDARRDLVLLLSKHPRDMYPEQEYDKVLARFNGRVLKQGSLSSDAIGYACDLLIAPGPSTEALKSAYRRVPSMFIFTETDALQLTNDRLPIALRVGASEGVFDYQDLKTSLERIINDNDYRNRLVEKMGQYFNSDGHSAERVAEVIKMAIK
ncbi:hypothetical protein A3J17_02710 [Candidatus Curtissbacteria bacterium RIFCSPLOWO2_02_FULL_40_11]|uniref:UDP-N-acetylglucosamine 2-epimerase domain-containing protein n=1 Tax=Candidatus Curtissbacteria bacterium RIFCSPHIGHO2_02_FULL_40_16b TaxID=1797714 RepID=A0A1F5GBW2_9BACT|nr:MAG: hypothetical protein A2775_01155 [Candidatus Curtissbacteria bacterium RIFCSPHIGHO2_01_FULL_39_57]OGD89314.1 MAG: hypothetical protein A3D04_00515 [Candidatus Curtissbacteria bacterium RIFCSPHIGHO2_02_FULL_40_16b]OGD99991.1 MAG: hypothetical protein A3J17_02710 [Candidatus Curtissbacteria bacterium RIFCSPLOWO2_02_FULL_40_11]